MTKFTNILHLSHTVDSKVTSVLSRILYSILDYKFSYWSKNDEVLLKVTAHGCRSRGLYASAISVTERD